MEPMSHFCVVLTLIAATVANPIANPCENADKITFPGDPMLRSVEVNGTTITCYSDGTPVTSSADTAAASVDLPSRIFGIFSSAISNMPFGPTAKVAGKSQIFTHNSLCRYSRKGAKHDGEATE